jgi:hypothetical protein
MIKNKKAISLNLVILLFIAGIIIALSISAISNPILVAILAIGFLLTFRR